VTAPDNVLPFRREIPSWVYTLDVSPRWNLTPIGYSIPRPDPDGLGAFVWRHLGRWRFDVMRGAEAVASGQGHDVGDVLRRAEAAYDAISET
jgi:hypothetical protein